MIQNLHTHTTFCDGKHSVEEMVLSAIEKGLKSLGFSGHAPIENELWATRDMDGYVKEVENAKIKYKDKLEVFLGLEREFYCDYPKYDYDYIITSVHGIKKENNVLWVDATKEIMQENVDKYYNGDVYRYIKEYYDLVVQASKYGDILGHFDLITKFNIENDIFDEYSEKYMSITKNALIECIKNDIIIEINTGAMERGYQNRFYPAPYLLNTMVSNNARIVVTADAHNKNAIDFYYDETVKILKDYGFKTQFVLTRNGFEKIEL